jgi:adenine deaminase
MRRSVDRVTPCSLVFRTPVVLKGEFVLRSRQQTRVQRRHTADVALGKVPADLVVRGGRVVNVFTRETVTADVAIARDRIAFVAASAAHLIGPDTEVVAAEDRFVLPGFIDTHSHVHESQLTISEYARAVLARGTTAVATDFYGELVVGGVEAVRACVTSAGATPLKLLYMLGTPGFYQNRPFGHSGWPSKDEMLEMLQWPECVGMDDSFAAYIADGEPDILDLVDAVQAEDRWVSSHAAELEGGRLQAWQAYLGETDDHECVTADDAVARARLGVYVSVREGAGCYNLEEVVKAITERNLDPRRFCLNTDVPSAVEIAELGHIDHSVRKAIGLGVDPLTAIQMATINAAECLKVQRDLGAVAPGKIADVLLVADLADPRPSTVIADGRVVAREGSCLESYGDTAFPATARATMRLRGSLDPAAFRIPADRDGVVPVRVIEANGFTVTTQEVTAELVARDGELLPDRDHDIMKIAALERVVGTGEMGLGFVTGFGIRGTYALATTFNSQQQNCIVTGSSDADMALAVNALTSVGGGFVAVRDGEVAGLLPLPLYGLLSDQSYEQVVGDLTELNGMIRSWGCPMPSPFPTLGFVGLPVDIGHLKICPEGLVDVWTRAVVPVAI